MPTPPHIENEASLDPTRYVLWRSPAGRTVTVGAEQAAVSLPDLPLPVHRCDLDDGEPSDTQLGQGIYDYLRQFPDCRYNREYAELLRDAFPHYLADMAAHVVMLDAKDVDSAYVLRKLSYLRILWLLDPANSGLLRQLCRGYYDLALTFNQLPQCRRHLLEAMRFGQALLKTAPTDPSGLNLLAEIDLLFGDYPGACNKWQRLIATVTDDRNLVEKLQQRISEVQQLEMPDSVPVDALEAVGEAMQLYAERDYRQATGILEALEVKDDFMRQFGTAEFNYLLGLCRIKTGDEAGAFMALCRALELDPDHAGALEALDQIQQGKA